MARYSSRKPNTARTVGRFRKPPMPNAYGTMQIANVHIDLGKVNLERDGYGLPHLSRNDARRRAEDWPGKPSLHKFLVDRPAHLGLDTSELPPAAPQIITGQVLPPSKDDK